MKQKRCASYFGRTVLRVTVQWTSSKIITRMKKILISWIRRPAWDFAIPILFVQQLDDEGDFDENDCWMLNQYEYIISYNLVYFLITYLAPLAIMAACYLQMGRFATTTTHRGWFHLYNYFYGVDAEIRLNYNQGWFLSRENQVLHSLRAVFLGTLNILMIVLTYSLLKKTLPYTFALRVSLCACFYL